MPLVAGACDRCGEAVPADLPYDARRQVDAGHLDRDCGGQCCFVRPPRPPPASPGPTGSGLGRPERGGAAAAGHARGQGWHRLTPPGRRRPAHLHPAAGGRHGPAANQGGPLMRAPDPFVHGRYRVFSQRADRSGQAFLVDRETIAGRDDLADGLIGTIRVRSDPADHRRRKWMATLTDVWTPPDAPDAPPGGHVNLGEYWPTPEAAAAAISDAADRRRAPHQL